jgi:hypothetical protein
MRRQSAKDKELEDNARLLKSWKKFHAEELEEALAGPHRHIIEPLVALLKHLDLQSSKPLLDFIRAQDWYVIDEQTKLVVLHEINEAICRLRTRANKQPWGEPATAFQVIRLIIVPVEGRPAEPFRQSME